MTGGVTLAPPTEAGRQAYTHLSRRQKLGLATEILVTYLRTRRGLRRHGLEVTLAISRSSETPTPPPGADALLTGLRLGRIVGKTLGALPADSRCLVRSVVLVALLAKRGIPSRLVIGVQPQPTFEAHAWVEYGGYELLPSGEAAHGRLADL
jgi:hypothetical protein